MADGPKNDSVAGLLEEVCNVDGLLNIVALLFVAGFLFEGLAIGPTVVAAD